MSTENTIQNNDGIDMDDMAQRLYSKTIHRDNVLHDAGADLSQPLGNVTAANSAWQEALLATRLTSDEGAALTSLVRENLSKAPTAEQKAAWNREAGKELTRKYGAKGARERLELAKQLVQRDPVFRHTLSQAGLMAHPKVVELLAARAFSLRASGKL